MLTAGDDLDLLRLTLANDLVNQPMFLDNAARLSMLRPISSKALAENSPVRLVATSRR